MTGGVAYNAAAVHDRFRDISEMRSFARWLIEQWDRTDAQDFVMRNEYVQGGGPMIWSYAKHSVELMRTVLDLSEQNRMVIAIPLIRLVTENAMTSIWLYLEPDNARAMVHEGFRQRRAALQDILLTGAEGFDSSHVDDANRVLDEFADADLPAGRHFDQRCKEIVGGFSVYCSWRVMSSYSHAGLAMGDFYLFETDQAPGVGFNKVAVMDHHEAWLGTAICMLIAAMKACNEIDGKGRLRSQLDRAMRRMKIGVELRSTRDEVV
jgi:hypothetical protein